MHGLGDDVALVHDYLNQRGGAERVVLELARMFPGAPIHTSLFRPGSTWSGFDAHTVRTSWLDRLPVDEGFRRLFPLYPLAMHRLGPIDADVVISSSSGWAHAVRTTPRALHVVYCHNPARWLYGTAYLDRSLAHRATLPLLTPLRRWDRTGALRADVYVANSEAVRKRIAAAYDIDAQIVYPPVDVDRFVPRPRGDRLLVVSRLLPYKRVDVVVAAATARGIGLDVVGTGPDRARLAALAGPTVTFQGALDDTDVTTLMEGCRALCLPGEEDFGITPVEAQAAGKPVVAFAAGGALETVVDGVTGAFFRRHDPEALIEALERCDRLDTAPETIAGHAHRFSPERFCQAMASVITAARERRRPAAASSAGLAR